MNERRRSPRWGGSLACRFSCEGKSQTGLVANLSFEGALLIADVELPSEGSEILLTLKPDRENVTLKAKVVFAGEGQAGLQFFGSKAENLEVLKPFFSL